MNWFDYVQFGLIGVMTFWIMKICFHCKETNKTNGNYKFLSGNSSLELENETDIMMFSNHDDKFDLSEKELSDKSTESAVVLGKLVEHFYQNVTNVDDSVAHGDDSDDGTHEKSIDCNKMILNDNHAGMSLYINHHSSSDVHDNNDNDESNKIRVSDLQLTGILCDMGTDLLCKSIANNVYLDQYNTTIEPQLQGNVELLSDDSEEIEKETNDLAENTDLAVDSGMCTTMEVNGSYNEHTDFVVNYGQHFDEIDDIATESKKDTNITDNDKTINVLDMLNREWTCEFHGLSEEDDLNTKDWANYCTGEYADEFNISTKYISEDNTHPSNLSNSGDNVNKVSDCQSMCSNYSTDMAKYYPQGFIAR